ncbi:MAG: T9SS type A sorting domain-containing protein [Lewinellaceae bacterium]|nr:T9SS type A sorting domain-containing protein [Lewinellaceae bacterium]
MKRIFILALLAWGISFTAFAQVEEPVCKSVDQIAAMEQAAHEGLLDFRSSPFTDNYDIIYQRMEWEVDPAQYYIQGSVTTYFSPTRNELSFFNLDLSTALQVSSVLYHGTDQLNFSHTADRLEISLPEAVAVGEMDSVTVVYGGAPPASGFGSFATSMHNGSPALWTLSEPYGAKEWWPTKQDLVDKIDSIDVYVRTPEAYRAASNGLLMSEVQDGNFKVYHWQHRHPIPAYLVAIAVSNYSVFSASVPVDGSQPIEVLNYVYPENLTSWQNAIHSTVESMTLYNQLFGLYPFADEKYGHAQFGWGGGMEHQTMSFMGGNSHSLQAHELAHQWFGDKVTCGSWADIWLNEGFATYLEGMTYEHGLGANTWMNWLEGKINHVTGQPDGSVFVDDTTSVNRIFSSRLSYSKGALLLHMLRWKLGDEAFFQGIRNYLDAPELAYGYAKTADLQYYLEQAGSQDLNEFFDDWFYGQGYPSYHINWWQDGNTVLVQIDQTTSHPSVDFFEMPVPVEFFGNGYNETKVFDNTYSGQVFTFQAPVNIAMVRFDPDLWICSNNNVVTKTEITGLAEALKAEVKAWPNPAHEQLNVQIPAALLPVQASLFDATGQEVLQTSLRDEKSEVDINSLPVGFYTLRLKSAGGSMALPVVKE